MKKIIIGIHGLGNQVPSAILHDWWKKSILEGLEYAGFGTPDLPFELVYWADILHPIPLDCTCKNPKDPLFVEDPYIKTSVGAKIFNSPLKQKIFKYLDSKLDKIFFDKNMILQLKGVADAIIHRYFSDFEAYLRDTCVSEDDPNCFSNTQIKNRLTQVLHKYREYDILLIAHSMGSIITFDVLSTLTKTVHINTVVTIGSPLGFPIITSRYFSQQKLTNPAIKKPVLPECVWPHWYNLSDPEDNVAIDCAISDDYEQNAFGVSIQDISVYNDFVVQGKRNPHKSYGYLRTPEIATIINAFFTEKSLGRVKFLVNTVTNKLKYAMKKLLKT